MAKFKTKLPTIEEMLEAGVHFGHQARRKNPNMDQYIYSTDSKNHVIDIFQTQELLESACESLFEIARSERQIVFVGTKRQASNIVKEKAIDAGAMYVVQRWLGGTLTNYDNVKGNWQELERLETGMKEDKFSHYTKKERLLIERKIEKLESFVGGIRNMNRHPGALVVVDVKREKTAVAEANSIGVPVFGIVDTNTDPSAIDNVIPANDDAIKSIELLITAMAGVVKEGYANPDKEASAKAQAAHDASELAIKEEKAAREAPRRRPNQRRGPNRASQNRGSGAVIQGASATGGKGVTPEGKQVRNIKGGSQAGVPVGARDKGPEKAKEPVEKKDDASKKADKKDEAPKFKAKPPEKKAEDKKEEKSDDKALETKAADSKPKKDEKKPAKKEDKAGKSEEKAEEKEKSIDNKKADEKEDVKSTKKEASKVEKPKKETKSSK